MRGVPYIQAPTSLLAMVDSSVGGKTAIDTPYGNNLFGAFWEPQRVIADINCLEKLPQKQFINGLLEAIKMFLTHDAKMVNYTLSNKDKILARDPRILEKIITKAIKIKIGVVERDEREVNERMTMNFGHTIGHAIELLSNYKLIHGCAVSLGILIEAKISQILGILSDKNYHVIENLITSLEVNKKELKKYKTQDIIKALQQDKKTQKGRPQFVLLENLGKVYRKDKKWTQEVSDQIIKKALELA